MWPVIRLALVGPKRVIPKSRRLLRTLKSMIQSFGTGSHGKQQNSRED
jgi:hypothetical protein